MFRRFWFSAVSVVLPAAVLPTLLMLFVLMSGGCADSGNTAVSGDGNLPPGPSGEIVFQVNWARAAPTGSYPMFVNDTITEWLRVRVKESGGYTAFADLTPVETSASLTVPVGTYAIDVLAMREEPDPPDHPGDVNPELLSFGRTTAAVLAGQTTQASVLLADSGALFTQPPASSVVLYGSMPQLSVTFANWPLELRQAAINFWVDSAPLQLLCSVPATIADETTRGCTSSVALGSSGSAIKFLATVDGSAYARDFGSGLLSLYPASMGRDGAKNFTLRSDSYVFAPTTGSIAVTIQ